MIDTYTYLAYPSDTTIHLLILKQKQTLNTYIEDLLILSEMFLIVK